MCSKAIKEINFVYQKALIRTIHTSFSLQNNLCEFTTREHTNKNSKTGFKRSFERFLVNKNKSELNISIISCGICIVNTFMLSLIQRFEGLIPKDIYDKCLYRIVFGR